MTAFHEGLKPSSSLYSTCHGAPLFARDAVPDEARPGLGKRIVAALGRMARRWQDAQVRAARRRSLEYLDSRTLKDLAYLDGDDREVREIMAQRYRDRLLS